jgi:7,8-dihydropterin-6-yl-methyl-4-(beta-D-ribofuranosyl)aminobenzene 5'-phosphate synthase
LAAVLTANPQVTVYLPQQALVVRTEKGLVVVTDCAHPEVDEMVTRAKQVGRSEIALAVGGFYLGGASRAPIEEIIGEFRWLGVQQVAPCHCTGDQARELFREVYGEGFYASGVGWQWQHQALMWRPASQGIPA